MRTALVVGAAGGIGGEVTLALARRGWRVRALTRSGAAHGEGIEPVRGDALNAADMRRAAEGAELIVHAVNPPGYRHWNRLVLPMLDNSLAAARARGARVLLPGTVYNYGPETFSSGPEGFPLIGEEAPQRPRTAKGAIRAEMERRLAAAVAAGDITALVVRAGDYFGPRAGNNWFGQALVKAGSRPRVLTYPGRPGVGHQWAYLPDVGETMARLAERGDLPAFARFHMDGQWDEDGTAMIGAIRHALGEPRLPVKKLPWTLMRLVSPMVPLFRELSEMAYLWRAPVRLDNARLVATLGEEPRTPLNEAVRATLIGLGCLAADPTVAAARG
ncbi:NAD-dependent epimerase/dehydratase family protein [Ancylobacter amanitiformis]|uniref:Nucleoside-diphosphate-sugar epimerase n=1 Tax=Ancylobacter amanitiformis TaxID=217069 RepID=A0ABU0LRU5_9HYPH|nr:NAD-dependent epimerase/dehydratase family protein [Ancylobacter amanitiformis]MDQ0511400.1 nucleoside-diphosphate-sugar epimerase [Ancylobacter amanitiformis]